MKSVTAAIIIRENKILITRRKAGSILSGNWEFPGGKIEDGESPQECLERELFEELGILSNPTKIIAESEYQYSHGSFKLLAILTSIQSESFNLTAHDDAKWVPIDKLLEYQLAPADIPIAKFIKEKNGQF